MHVRKKGLQGGVYKGGDCRKILKDVSSSLWNFVEELQLEASTKVYVIKYCDTLEAFQSVIEWLFPDFVADDL